MGKENLFMRPHSHEIDTIARRIIPNALPSAWEYRETTGRDYGIDMTVELFEKGSPTGNSLLLQIKGTENLITGRDETIVFDMPVNTLKYSELFVVPVLLIICPIANE